MAAAKFGTRVDLQGNEILNMLFQKVNGLPTASAALTGAVRFNTATGRMYICDGTAWKLFATDSDALQGLSPAQLRDRSTHTGTQTAASISDFDTQVRANRLSQLLAPNTAVAWGGQKITGLADGSSNNDAVNYGQLQVVRDIAINAAASIAIKAPVKVAATGNVTLSGTQTIDGIALAVADRVLLPNQTNAVENGIYVVASGAWARASDADGVGEVAPGTQVFVTQGTVNGDTAWVIISDSPINPGTDPQGWTKVPGSSGSSYTWGAGLQNTANTISVKPGLGITVVDGSVAIDTNVVVRKVPLAIPAGTSPVAMNHGLGTSDIAGVCLREVSTGDIVMAGFTVTGTNTVSIDFATNPVANQYRVVISG